MKLSVVMITKNEESQIRRCLDSIKGIADEIIVVDDESTDATVKICEEYGARVFINRSDKDFAKQRNVGVRHALGEWVFSMDADEVIPKETAEAILATVASPGEYVAYNIPRNNFFFGKPILDVDLQEAKLFKRSGVFFEGEVHEALKVGGPVGIMKQGVDHYPFESMKKMMGKCAAYCDISAEQYLRKKVSITKRELIYQLTWKAFKCFARNYIKKKSYRSGFVGFTICILHMASHEFYWCYVLEKAKKSGKLLF